MYLLLISVVSFTAAGPAVAALTTPVAAQQTAPNNTTTTTTTENGQTIVHQLGEDARITNVTWNGRTVEITVSADEYTTVAVTDAGALSSVSEGSVSEIPYQTYTVPGDTERTLEFTVADSGTRAVTVQSGDTMIAIVEEKGNRFLAGSSAGWDEVQAAALAASLVVGGVAVVTGILTWYAMRRDYRRVV